MNTNKAGTTSSQTTAKTGDTTMTWLPFVGIAAAFAIVALIVVVVRKKQ